MAPPGGVRDCCLGVFCCCCVAPLGLAIRKSAGRGEVVVWAGTDWQAHRVGVVEADKALRELPLGMPKAAGSTGRVTLGPKTVQLDGVFASLGLTEPPAPTCEDVAERCSLGEDSRVAKAPDEADEANLVVL